MTDKIVFYTFKQMFNEHLYSIKRNNMMQEVRIKAAMYNKLVGREAGVV